jgi:FkbM family methyltransferase
MKDLVRRPAPFAVLATGHGALIVNRNDYRMTSETDGYGVGFDLFNTSYFEPEEVYTGTTVLKLRRQFYGDGVVALDAGANIGVHTVEWAKVMHGWGRVTAFEAQERIFYALAGNIAINNCFNAKAIHAALGAVDGILKIPSPDYTQPSSFGSLELRRRKGVEFIGQDVSYRQEDMVGVGQVAIDNMGLARLDYVKIDVEGMEIEVLAGARQTLARCRPVMLIELIKTNRHQLAEMLGSIGYLSIAMGRNALFVHREDACLNHILSSATA